MVRHTGPRTSLQLVCHKPLAVLRSPVDTDSNWVIPSQTKLHSYRKRTFFFARSESPGVTAVDGLALAQHNLDETAGTFIYDFPPIARRLSPGPPDIELMTP